MENNNLASKLSKFIIYASTGLAILVIIFRSLSGFDEEEASLLIKYLTPINSLYLAAAIKYLISTKNKPPVATTISKDYVSIIKYIFYGHWFIIYLLLIFSAFNIIDFKQHLEFAFAIIEISFGIFVGTIIGDLFKTTES